MKFYTHQKLSLPSFISIRSSFIRTLYIACMYGLGFMLGFSGISKMIDATRFLAIIQQIQFLNNEGIVVAAILLPIIELALAGALFLTGNHKLLLPLYYLLAFWGLPFMVMGWSGGNRFGWGMVV